MSKLTRALALTLCLGLSAWLPSPAQATRRVEQVGTTVQYLLPVVALAESAHEKDRKGALQLVESSALSAAVTGLLKETVHERRPNGGMHSFPSGHASISFTVAEFLRQRYGGEWGYPAYAAAAFVGYSRVAAHKHHTHDVLAGALIGIGSSHLFTHPFHGFQASVEPQRDGLELVFSRRF